MLQKNHDSTGEHLGEQQADLLLQGQLEVARKCLRSLALLSSEEKNRGLTRGGESLRDQATTILQVNAQDVDVAHERGLDKSKISRLTLDAQRLEGVIAALDAVVALPDPVGSVMASWKRPNGMHIDRVRVPIGLVGMIYEARPNVTIDALSLCLKSGNGVLLRPGSDCAGSARALFDIFKQGWESEGLVSGAMAITRTNDRALVGAMLRAQGLLDVIVPRGGESLVARVLQESKVPVFAHLSGLCHTYVDESSDLAMALALVINAKMRSTAICGALETLLVHKDIASKFLPELNRHLVAEECVLKGCKRSCEIVPGLSPATEEDWHTEYLDAVLSCRVVDSISDAIAHIDKYGSGHTDCIVTESKANVKKFMEEIDSAIVMHNVSSQFADGGEFGMGAEIGIATGRLHARGPVALEQMTTMQYRVSGKGQCRD